MENPGNQMEWNYTDMLKKESFEFPSDSRGSLDYQCYYGRHQLYIFLNDKEKLAVI